MIELRKGKKSPLERSSVCISGMTFKTVENAIDGLEEKRRRYFIAETQREKRREFKDTRNILSLTSEHLTS